jgi:hypothetical protein
MLEIECKFERFTSAAALAIKIDKAEDDHEKGRYRALLIDT